MKVTWEFPKFDDHLFESSRSKYFSVITYTDSEIGKMIDILQPYSHTHPICLSVIHLLQATYHFKCSTTLDPFFVALRLKNKSPQELADILALIAEELKLADKELKKLDEHSKDYKFFYAAINYCRETIKRRIEELKASNDVIYEDYWHESALKKMLFNT